MLIRNCACAGRLAHRRSFEIERGITYLLQYEVRVAIFSGYGFFPSPSSLFAPALDIGRLTMVSRLLQFFAFAALAVGCTAVAPTGCAVSASVDHHIARPALDASVTPTFGWQLSSGCAGVQQAYRIVVTTSATALVVWDSGRTQSNSSANIACGVALEHGRRGVRHLSERKPLASKAQLMAVRPSPR